MRISPLRQFTVRCLTLGFLLAGFGAAVSYAEEAKQAEPEAQDRTQPAAAAGENAAAAKSAEAAAPAKPSLLADGSQVSRITREGVVVEFKATPLGPAGRPKELKEGEFAELEFRISSVENGEPLQGVYPGVWVDLVQTAEGQKPGTGLECKQRVGTYLQGLVGMRPMIDLNSYYLLVMNRQASISVIDPVVSITGMTSLYADIPLTRPGGDWAKTADENWLYVSLPRAGEVAVVDLATFKVKQNVAAGDKPMRVALQPDEKYLWVGNDAEAGETGGVTVIDTRTLEVAAEIATGVGHHEIVFSADSRYAFVSNRDGGTVSVIDVASLEKIRDIDTGPLPIALAYSALSKALYVADGKTGEVAVIDAERLDALVRIKAKPGLGPLRFSEDGRWGIMVNPAEDEVYVIDASTNRIAHTVPIAGKPFQVGMSRAFAYVRVLESEQVSMINLQALDKGGEVIVNTFAAGSFPPAQAKDISIADAIVPAAQEAAVMVVSPSDATVYYYMEGMNAPMGAFRNYGYQPRAVQIANRALQEKEPGVYSSIVRIPAGGTFEVAFLNETPRFLHCFEMQAKLNPRLRSAAKPLAIEYLVDERTVTAGDTLQFRFRLIDPATGQAQTDIKDARVKYYRAPSFDLRQVQARHVEDGIYEAALPFRRPGAYYLYVGAPSRDVAYDDLAYLTMMAVRAPKQAATKATQKAID